MYESLLRPNFGVTCEKCGQIIRSEARLKNHLKRCIATGNWYKKFNREMNKHSQLQIKEEA